MALPDLLKIKSRELKNYDCNKLTVVALQHLLPTIEHLFLRILKHDVLPENIHLLGKRYSTIQDVKSKLDSNHKINVHTCRTVNFEAGRYKHNSFIEAEAFWRAILNKGVTRDILILDEGGLLRESMPAELIKKSKKEGLRIIGMEHTSSGWNKNITLDYPLILKSRSFAKLRYESKFIVKALVDRLLDDLPILLGTSNTLEKNQKNKSNGRRKCRARESQKTIGVKLPTNEELREEVKLELRKHAVGIVGIGHLGFALSKYLSEIGVESILGYDTAPDFFDRYGKYSGFKHQHIERTKLHDLVTRSTVVFGCAGSTIKDIHLPLYTESYQRKKFHQEGLNRKTKIFASCSSGDLEFEPIIMRLRNIDRKYALDPFQNASGMIGQYHAVLLNGGFPINFDRQKEREPEERILLTRELTYASFLQAIVMLENDDMKPRAVELCPEMQKCIVNRWVENLAKGKGLNYSGYLENHECKELDVPFSPPLAINSWRRSEGDRFDFDFVEDVEETEEHSEYVDSSYIQNGISANDSRV